MRVNSPLEPLHQALRRQVLLRVVEDLFLVHRLLVLLYLAATATMYRLSQSVENRSHRCLEVRSNNLLQAPPNQARICSEVLELDNQALVGLVAAVLQLLPLEEVEERLVLLLVGLRMLEVHWLLHKHSLRLLRCHYLEMQLLRAVNSLLICLVETPTLVVVLSREVLVDLVRMRQRLQALVLFHLVTAVLHLLLSPHLLHHPQEQHSAQDLVEEDLVLVAAWVAHSHLARVVVDSAKADLADNLDLVANNHNNNQG